MQIAFLTPSLAPFSADPAGSVCHGLAKGLRLLKHEVTIVSPLYSNIDPAKLALARRLDPVRATLGDEAVEFVVFEGRSSSGVQHIFLQNSQYFDQPFETGTDADEQSILRYVHFSAAGVAVMRELASRPEIVHCHDWPVALGLLLANELEPAPRTVYSIYSLDQQGRLPETAAANLGLNRHSFARSLIYSGTLNFVAGAVRKADRIVTTSLKQADAILHEPEARGLSHLLAERSHPPVGIRNGVDSSVWNPATDTLSAAKFDAVDTSAKTAAKSHLQYELDLQLSPDTPMFAVALPADDGAQKQIAAVLPALLRNDVQIVMLGPHSTALDDGLQQLSGKHQGHVRFAAGSDELLHQAISGADFWLSLGATALGSDLHLAALRYGTVPVVLSLPETESIVDLDAELESGTGFVFDKLEPELVLAACQRAVAAFGHAAFAKLRKRIMTVDSSWERASRYYEQVYREVVQERDETPLA